MLKCPKFKVVDLLYDFLKALGKFKDEGIECSISHFHNACTSKKAKCEASHVIDVIFRLR